MSAIEADERAALLAELLAELRKADLIADLVGNRVRVTLPKVPGKEVRIWCARRASDKRLWFVAQRWWIQGEGSRPLVPAERLGDAVSGVVNLIRDRM